MSNQENDKIWDKVVDKALDDPREAMSYEAIMSMDLEDAFEYLAYGRLPKGLERMIDLKKQTKGIKQ